MIPLWRSLGDREEKRVAIEYHGGKCHVTFLVADLPHAKDTVGNEVELLQDLTLRRAEAYCVAELRDVAIDRPPPACSGQVLPMSKFLA